MDPVRFAGPFLLLTVLAAPVAAQTTAAPDGYAEALARLEAGDTARALDLLRDVTRANPGYGPAFLRLGAVLSRHAGELEENFQLRLEAEKALSRAVTLLDADPEALLEYGLLLVRQRTGTDARRVLERAWEASVRKGGAMSAARRAELQYNLARVYEDWWEDWHNLVQIPTTVDAVSCRAFTHALGDGSRTEADVAEAPVACPAAWYRLYDHVVWIADLKADERARMLTHFRAALEADPAHTAAGTRLLGHLADDAAWGEYMRVARRLVDAVPDDARVHLFLGLGLHESGREDEAAAAFDVALGLLPPEERSAFLDITPLLDERVRARYAALDSAGRAEAARVFFAAKDPLYLSAASERRLEHYARMAWAELKFGVPARGLPGWASDRGRIWVRYGPPVRWYQCCYGGGGGRGLLARRIYWSYGEQGPLFIFEKQLMFDRARLSPAAQVLAETLEKTAPEIYRPVTIASLHALPHQVASFRGDSGGTRVEVYAHPPADSLAPAGGRLATGFFLLGPGYRTIWERRDTIAADGLGRGLSYRLEVPPGPYAYSIEARTLADSAGPTPVARAREALPVPTFRADSLAVSDILLAHEVAPRVPSPARRADLDLWPRSGTVLAQGEPIHLYFEVYGLEPDDAGLATYSGELAVQDSTQRNLVQRLARGAAELFRSDADREPRVGWERTGAVVDGVAIDYLRVEVPALEPGEYVVRLKIRDGQGREAEAVRRFGVVR